MAGGGICPQDRDWLDGKRKMEEERKQFPRGEANMWRKVLWSEENGGGGCQGRQTGPVLEGNPEVTGKMTRMAPNFALCNLNLCKIVFY